MAKVFQASEQLSSAKSSSNFKVKLNEEEKGPKSQQL